MNFTKFLDISLYKQCIITFWIHLKCKSGVQNISGRIFCTRWNYGSYKLKNSHHQTKKFKNITIKLKDGQHSQQRNSSVEATVIFPHPRVKSFRKYFRTKKLNAANCRSSYLKIKTRRISDHLHRLQVCVT